MQFLTVLLFAVALSTDGFLVGAAYGSKKIRIPLISLIIISSISVLVVTLAMLLGKTVAGFLSPGFAARIGAIILITIGLYYLIKAAKSSINNIDNSVDEPLIIFSIKPLGVIIKILKEPSSADMDLSGEISEGEAMLLGLALSMDAFGAGIGLAMSNFNILYTAISVGVIQFMLVNIGLSIGRMMENERFQIISAFIPGVILMTIGIVKFV